MEILEYVYSLILKVFEFMKNTDVFGINIFTLYISYAVVSLFLIWFFVYDDD